MTKKMSNTNYIKLYRTNSVPLEEAERISEGEIVYSSTGKCFECVGFDTNGSSVFEQLHESELVDGEFLENLEDNLDTLKLFWPG
jgi:hypothetical protein